MLKISPDKQGIESKYKDLEQNLEELLSEYEKKSDKTPKFIMKSERSDSEESIDKKNDDGRLAVGLKTNIESLTCKCKKSKCLKLYCDCFAEGIYCNPDCSCVDCFNQADHEDERQQMISSLLFRNPEAFKPKLETSKSETQHSKGCNCKRSNCLKKYCECYQAGVKCAAMCRCKDCLNIDEEKYSSNETEWVKKSLKRI